MKKLLLLALSGIILTATAFGQEKEKIKKVELGVYGGIGFSRMVFKMSGKKRAGNALNRWNGGITVEFQKDRIISFESGLSYRGLGGGDPLASGAILDYLIIPALVKYNPRQGDFSMFAGPQIGILTSYKEKKENYNTSIALGKENFKKSDISFLMGLSLRPDMKHFVISVAYQKGFTNIMTEDRSGYRDSAKNNAYILTVGYRF